MERSKLFLFISISNLLQNLPKKSSKHTHETNNLGRQVNPAFAWKTWNIWSQTAIFLYLILHTPKLPTILVLLILDHWQGRDMVSPDVTDPGKYSLEFISLKGQSLNVSSSNIFYPERKIYLRENSRCDRVELKYGPALKVQACYLLIYL